MKKKKLALLLAVAMIVTSIDSTAMIVNAADFTSEEVQEQSVEFTDEPSEATVETDAETEDGGVLSENSSEDESIEITDEPQESADTGVKIPGSIFRKNLHRKMYSVRGMRLLYRMMK